MRDTSLPIADVDAASRPQPAPQPAASDAKIPSHPRGIAKQYKIPLPVAREVAKKLRAKGLAKNPSLNIEQVIQQTTAQIKQRRQTRRDRVEDNTAARNSSGFEKLARSTTRLGVGALSAEQVQEQQKQVSSNLDAPSFLPPPQATPASGQALTTLLDKMTLSTVKCRNSDGSFNWMAFEYFVNAARMEHLVDIMLREQLIAINVNQSTYMGALATVLLTTANVMFNRAMTLANQSAVLSQFDSQRAAGENRALANFNPVLPGSSQNIWQASEKYQTRGPFGDILSREGLRQFTSRPTSQAEREVIKQFETEGWRAERETIEGGHQGDKFVLDKHTANRLAEWHRRCLDPSQPGGPRPEDMLLFERHPNEVAQAGNSQVALDGLIKRRLLSPREEKLLDKIATQMKMPHIKQQYEALRDDILTRRIDDVPGQLGITLEEQEKLYSAADAADQHANRLRAESAELRAAGDVAAASAKEKEAEVAQRYAKAHRDNAKSFDTLITNLQNNLAKRMHTVASRRKTYGELRMNVDSYQHFITKLENTHYDDPGREALRKELITDLQRRCTVLYRALAPYRGGGPNEYDAPSKKALSEVADRTKTINKLEQLRQRAAERATTRPSDAARRDAHVKAIDETKQRLDEEIDHFSQMMPTGAKHMDGRQRRASTGKAQKNISELLDETHKLVPGLALTDASVDHEQRLKEIWSGLSAEQKAAASKYLETRRLALPHLFKMCELTWQFRHTDDPSALAQNIAAEKWFGINESRARYHLKEHLQVLKAERKTVTKPEDQDRLDAAIDSAEKMTEWVKTVKWPEDPHAPTGLGKVIRFGENFDVPILGRIDLQPPTPRDSTGRPLVGESGDMLSERVDFTNPAAVAAHYSRMAQAGRAAFGTYQDKWWTTGKWNINEFDPMVARIAPALEQVNQRMQQLSQQASQGVEGLSQDVLQTVEGMLATAQNQIMPMYQRLMSLAFTIPRW